MTTWNLVSAYGAGEILDTLEGSLDKARHRRRELKKEHGSGIIITETIC